MAQKLPPLTALRAFEAAARLESFSQAAEEIHVTHGAVSHQVKGLEAFLGVALFARTGRRVLLTGDGKFFAERVRAAMQQIGEAAAAISRHGRANRLAVSTMPSFASRWLMPRIGRFMDAHPDLEVSIHSSLSLVDFVRDEIDVAVRFGDGDWPNVNAELVMRDEYFPVCSPRLNRGRLPRRPQDLSRFKLLLSDQEPWTPWFRAAGVDLPEPTGPEFNDAALMLQATEAHRGIALTRRSITEADIAAGKLVRLFDVALPAARAYYLVWPKNREASKNILAFRDWLIGETKRKNRAPAKPAAVK
jgi:LysR family glycine cleavage system transcriptional activator